MISARALLADAAPVRWSAEHLPEAIRDAESGAWIEAGWYVLGHAPGEPEDHYVTLRVDFAVAPDGREDAEGVARRLAALLTPASTDVAGAATAHTATEPARRARSAHPWPACITCGGALCSQGDAWEHLSGDDVLPHAPEASCTICGQLVGVDDAGNYPHVDTALDAQHAAAPVYAGPPTSQLSVALAGALDLIDGTREGRARAFTRFSRGVAADPAAGDLHSAVVAELTRWWCNDQLDTDDALRDAFRAAVDRLTTESTEGA